MKNGLLEYKGYHASIALNTEDNIFVGSVIGIDDSLNFHGTSIDELKTQFEICIDDYLEMCEYFHKCPDKEYKGSFNVRITPELHKKIDISASELGITLNQFVTNALEEFYNKKPVVQKIFIAAPMQIKWEQKIDTDNYESHKPIFNTGLATVKGVMAQ